MLLALAIIGVIAAITLPGLRTRLLERRTIASHAKYCNILDSAIEQLWVDQSLNSTNYMNSMTRANLVPYLQIDTTTNTFKDGAILGESTIVDNTSATINVTFPDNTHVQAAAYTVNPSYEGINCQAYINTLTAQLNGENETTDPDPAPDPDPDPNPGPGPDPDVP
ncbi:hypothetical protein IJI31_01780 [bacterium]|nr:hypothetical protein [bacterium]